MVCSSLDGLEVIRCILASGKKKVQIANAIKKIDSDKVLFKIFTLDSVKDRNVLIQYKY